MDIPYISPPIRLKRSGSTSTMTSIPSFSGLMALLPLLAHLPSIAASPFLSDRSMLQSRATQTPLSFQSVGDAGISAQMVSPTPFLSLPELLLMYRCSSAQTRRSTFSTKWRTTLSMSPVSMAHILRGQSSTTLTRTPVSKFNHEYVSQTNHTDRTMDVESNTFCACGGEMGNGTWAVFGGNQRQSGEIGM